MVAIAPLQLVLWPSKILKTLAIPVKEFDKEYLFHVSEMLTAVMFMYQGSGIAANQCGLDLKMCIINREDPLKPLVFINPTITSYDPKTEKYNEGCLSLPGITAVKVERPVSINIEYQDFEGIKLTTTLTGLEARSALHELDHLAGLSILDRIGPVQRRLLEKRYKKIIKQVDQWKILKQQESQTK